MSFSGVLSKQDLQIFENIQFLANGASSVNVQSVWNFFEKKPHIVTSAAYIYKTFGNLSNFLRTHSDIFTMQIKDGNECAIINHNHLKRSLENFPDFPKDMQEMMPSDRWDISPPAFSEKISQDQQILKNIQYLANDASSVNVESVWYAFENDMVSSAQYIRSRFGNLSKFLQKHADIFSTQKRDVNDWVSINHAHLKKRLANFPKETDMQPITNSRVSRKVRIHMLGEVDNIEFEALNIFVQFLKDVGDSSICWFKHMIKKPLYLRKFTEEYQTVETFLQMHPNIFTVSIWGEGKVSLINHNVDLSNYLVQKKLDVKVEAVQLCVKYLKDLNHEVRLETLSDFLEKEYLLWLWITNICGTFKDFVEIHPQTFNLRFDGIDCFVSLVESHPNDPILYEIDESKVPQLQNDEILIYEQIYEGDTESDNPSIHGSVPQSENITVDQPLKKRSCNVEIEDGRIEKILDILPNKWVIQLEGLLENLCEIEIQIGRPPHLYYFKKSGFTSLIGDSIQDDLQEMTKDRIFVQKNRSFIEETLHRISITKGLNGTDLTAVTLRIGRPISGISEIFRDIVLEDKSILFLGSPGVGKTSMIRDLARLSSQYKKTIVIDSSCEISGYSAHPVIGDAYVVYVPEKSTKEEVMIHAIENRTPEAMIVDEISNIYEFSATQTAATRGVILYTTAHGTLKDIKVSTIVLKCLGGVTSVTLGDAHLGPDGEKTKLESKGPPIFDVIVEFSKEDLFTWYVYRDIPNLLKSLFKRKPVDREVRQYDENSKSWTERNETVVLEDSNE